jgi:hypothetical protein
MKLINLVNVANATLTLLNHGQDMNSLTTSDSSNTKQPSEDHDLLQIKQIQDSRNADKSIQEEAALDQEYYLRASLNSLDIKKDQKGVVCTLEAKLRHPKSADAVEGTYKMKRADWLMIEKGEEDAIRDHDDYCHQQLDRTGSTATNPGGEGWCTYEDIIGESGNHYDVFTLENIAGVTSTFILSHWYVHPCSNSIDRFNRHYNHFFGNEEELENEGEGKGDGEDKGKGSKAAVLTVTNKGKNIILNPENGWSHADQMDEVTREIVKKKNNRSLGHEGKMSISVHCNEDCDCTAGEAIVLS